MKVSVHPGQKNQNHLCLKYITRVPQLQNSYLKDAKTLILMNWGVRKPECQFFCPWPISPALQWDRKTHFPPSAGGERHSSCLDGAPCPALHMDWTLPCLSFLLLFSAEQIHQSWRWSFPLAFVLIAFFKYLVQACLYSTLAEVGYFLPGALVAGDGGEPGRRPASGKGPWEAGRALGRAVCRKEEKSAKVEGDRKGNKGNGQTRGLRLRWGGEWVYMVLSEGWEDNLDGDREKHGGQDRLPKIRKRRSEDKYTGMGTGNKN